MTGTLWAPPVSDAGIVYWYEKLPLPLSWNWTLGAPPSDDKSPETAIPVLVGLVPGTTETCKVTFWFAVAAAGLADAVAEGLVGAYTLSAMMALPLRL